VKVNVDNFIGRTEIEQRIKKNNPTLWLIIIRRNVFDYVKESLKPMNRCREKRKKRRKSHRTGGRGIALSIKKTRVNLIGRDGEGKISFDKHVSGWISFESILSSRGSSFRTVDGAAVGWKIKFLPSSYIQAEGGGIS
jgi:hypothetical protein